MWRECRLGGPHQRADPHPQRQLINGLPHVNGTCTARQEPCNKKAFIIATATLFGIEGTTAPLRLMI
jgi:hypothetical protein